jgi:hypothetical protein
MGVCGGEVSTNVPALLWGVVLLLGVGPCDMRPAVFLLCFYGRRRFFYVYGGEMVWGEVLSRTDFLLLLAITTK